MKKGFEHRKAYNNWEPLRKRAWDREELSPEENEKKEHNLENMHELEQWFLDQIQNHRLKNDFEPYLKMPDEL